MAAPYFYYYGPAPAAPYYYYYQPPQIVDDKTEPAAPSNYYYQPQQIDDVETESESSPEHYADRVEYDCSRAAQLEWATENPVRLRVSLHCKGCCWKLDEDLRDLDGVYDVSISGWSDSMVTVTGMASTQSVLARARASAQHAELW